MPRETSLESFYNELARIVADLSDILDRRLRDLFELPLALYQTLAVVERTPDCRVHDIGKTLGLTTGGVSKLVDRAEARGFCTRAPNPDDGRSSLLALTAGGATIVEQARSIVETELHDTWSHISPSRAADVAELLSAKIRRKRIA